MATKANLLKKLERAMPVADEQIRKQQEAARSIQLQRQVSQAPTTAPVAATSQAIGANQAKLAGQTSVANMQRTGQENQQLRAVAQKEQEQRLQGTINEQKLGLSNQELIAKSQNAEQRRTAEDQILADRLTFKKDEQGRTEFQESQLIDLAVVKAEDQIDLQKRLSIIDRASRQDIEMLQALAARLDASLKGEYKQEAALLNQNTRMEIAVKKAAIEKEIARKKAASSNRLAAFTSVATIGGAVVGGMYGGPTGATAGAQAGGGLGSFAAGSTA